MSVTWGGVVSIDDSVNADWLHGSDGQLRTADAALRFILAGNAYFTLRSEKTGVRYTYSVTRADDDNQQAMFSTSLSKEPRWFVALLKGPDNSADYAYLGMITGEKVPVFRLTRKSKMTTDSAPVRAFGYALSNLVRGCIPEALKIFHDGKCGRCGRHLTTPESVERGIGPECAEKMGLL